MACGCEKKKDADPAEFDANTPYSRWHIVIISADVHPGVYALLDQVNALGVCWCVVDTSYRGSLRPDVTRLGGDYVHLPSEQFNWPIAAAVGAATRAHAERYLFLHDDVTLPSVDPLPAFEAALADREVGMAVPRIVGAMANDAQAEMFDCALPWFPTSEFVSGCCFAVRGDDFRVHNFDERMDGYDWYHIHLQARLSSMGRIAAVVPSVTVQHIGMQTFGKDLKRTSAGWLPNMQRFSEWNGSGKGEYNVRPKIVRLPASSVERSLILLVDTDDSFCAALGVVENATDCGEVVMLDRVPTLDRRRKLLAATQPDTMPVKYAPDYGGLRQAINLAGGRLARVYELQSGSPLPCVPIDGPRIRCGWEWNMPHAMLELHVGMLKHAGLGDTLMTTPALHAFRQVYRHIRIVVHHVWQAADIFQHNPDLDEVLLYNTESQTPRPDLFDMMSGTGGEGVMPAMYRNLGIEDLAHPAERRIRYYLQAEEHLAACALLRSLMPALPDAPRLVGVQLHGGWAMKAWAHSDALIGRLLDEGAVPVLYGIDKDRTPEITRLSECIQITDQPIRMAIAVVGLLDTWVGFDSGLTYAASAVKTPIVAMFGHLDPRGLIIETHAPNMIAIRRKTPEDCLREHGRNCKPVGGNCPLRDGRIGSDCLDEISVDDVMDGIAKLPLWGLRLEERFHGL